MIDNAGSRLPTKLPDLFNNSSVLMYFSKVSPSFAFELLTSYSFLLRLITI